LGNQEWSIQLLSIRALADITSFRAFAWLPIVLCKPGSTEANGYRPARGPPNEVAAAGLKQDYQRLEHVTNEDRFIQTANGGMQFVWGKQSHIFVSATSQLPAHSAEWSADEFAAGLLPIVNAIRIESPDERSITCSRISSGVLGALMP
jgi:hypothetical protein